MTERLDALFGRKDAKSGKTYWTKIGAAFASERGGYSVMLDCLPGPDPQTGQYRILLAVPRPKDGAGKEPYANTPADTDIPF